MYLFLCYNITTILSKENYLHNSFVNDAKRQIFYIGIILTNIVHFSLRIFEFLEFWGQCFGSVLIFSGSGSRGWCWRPIRIQGFNDQKLNKNYSWKKKYMFWSKTAIYLFLGIHKLCPSYRRSLQLTKEAIQHFKTWTFQKKILLLWVIFALLDPHPDSGSTGPIEYGSNPDPDPKPCVWAKDMYYGIRYGILYNYR